MGHTLVAGFSEHSREKLRRLLRKAGLEDAVKIPYKRDCDRREANRVLSHHITLVHWAKEEDPVYLKRLENFRFPGRCLVRVREPAVCHAENGSLMLYLKVEPTEEFQVLLDSVSAALGTPTTRFLHITLAISRDHDKIREAYRALQAGSDFPLLLKVSCLELYHIWSPVKLVREFR